MEIQAKRIWSFLALILIASIAQAQIREYAVEVSAEVQVNPPALVFSWPVDNRAKGYVVYRKSKEADHWEELMGHLKGSATGYVDQDVSEGQSFEYGFYKTEALQQFSLQIENGRKVNFSIRDTWNDGICCIHGFGKYTIKGKKHTYAEGGSFSTVENKSFLVNGGAGTNKDEIVISIVLDVFAEETTWNLTDQESGELLASGGPYEGHKYGHIYAGIELPPIEYRGIVALIIEKSLTKALPEAIAQLELDLIGDGWQVKRFEVEKNEEVKAVKKLIQNHARNNPNLEAVFLLGHVPVPYSGNIMSAHVDHCGAYPADLYYGELDGPWTDNQVSNISANRPANHNIPGDKKFDQTWLPSDVDLQVGRVDLSDLSSFKETEIELTRQYLQKDHDYRMGVTQTTHRGLITNSLDEMGGMAVGAIGFRNFSAMFGSVWVNQGTFLGTLDSKLYQWAQGCGEGSYTSCGSVGTTLNFTTMPVKAIFTMLYGSYFGDWDSQDNLMRALLASKPSVLTCCWAGAPAWHLHHMALGETIGYSTRISQNNSTLYAPSDRVRQVHVALMGDPTLRLHVVMPPKDVVATREGNQVNLEWTPSSDIVKGYFIYRADSVNGRYVRLNDIPIWQHSYQDQAPADKSGTYMVRAVKLESGGSGTYYNLSQGVLDSASSSVYLLESANRISMLCYPNPTNGVINIRISTAKISTVQIRLLSLDGRLVASLFDGNIESGETYIQFFGLDQTGHFIGRGIYICQCLSASSSPVYRRVVVM